MLKNITSVLLKFADMKHLESSGCIPCVATAVIIGIACLFAMRSIFKKKYLPSSGRAVLITGCDSGIGLEASLMLDGLGFKVFAGCLFPEGDGAKKMREDASGNLEVLPLDVTNDESVNEAMRTVQDHLIPGENLWAVVNNAGVCIMGMFEWLTWKQIQMISEVNIVGTIRVTRTFLPLLKKSKGRLVIVSSIAATMPIPGTSVYNASKWALEGLANTLRMELQGKAGVKVIVLQPGDHSKHTNITKQQRQHSDSQWENMSQEMRTEVGANFDAFTDSVTTSKSGKKMPKEVQFQIVLDHMREAVQGYNPRARYLSTFKGIRIFMCIFGKMPTAVQDYLTRLLVTKTWKLHI